MVQESQYSFITATAQIFNIGVSIFIIISGFCFGLQGHICDVKKWYLKRVKRIFIPYELFFILLAGIYFVKGIQFDLTKWLSCVLGIQGANVGVLGADQTWFMTPLLLCYLITPAVSAFCDKYGVSKFTKICVLIEVLCIPVVLSFFQRISCFTMGAPVSFYVAAYYLGRNFRNVRWGNKAGIIFGITILTSFACRVIVRAVADGTRIYDCITVTYRIRSILLHLQYWDCLHCFLIYPS